MSTLPRQRDKVLALVRESLEPLDAPAIASYLGIHITTARFHLNSLIKEGVIEGKMLPPTTVGRPRKGYIAVDSDPSAPLMAALLAQLGQSPDQRHEKAVAAGRIWADSLADINANWEDLPDPVSVVAAILTRLGFQVTNTMSFFGTHEIQVCNCPLRKIAYSTPEIVVGIQQGLVERALERYSPALTPYHVDVYPDVSGECGVTLRLSGTRKPAADPAQ